MCQRRHAPGLQVNPFDYKEETENPVAYELSGCVNALLKYQQMTVEKSTQASSAAVF
jgi:hypothetical protein